MKNLFIITLTILAITINGYSQVKVSYDFDKETDFSKFSSYNFTEEAMKLPVNDLNRKRLLTAVDNEMSKRGFSKTDNPDLLIDLKVTTEMKQSATATTDWYGSGYRYRWGSTFTTTNIDITEYTEGTIFVDLIDTSTSKLVWQGRGIGTIHPSVKAEKREKRINKGLAKIFKNYPPAL